MKRKLMLIPSVAIALAVYTGLFWAAPRVHLITTAGRFDRVGELFNVQIRDVPEETSYILPETATETLVEEPRSVSDLIDSELNELPLAETDTAPQQVPDLQDRIASERVDREHDLEADERVLSQVDSKILEITEDVARQDIQVARRLVRPSPDRALSSDDVALRRGPDSDGSGLLGLDAAVGSGAASESGDAAAADESTMARAALPVFEEGVLSPDESANRLPELPIERVMPQEIVQQEIREERPYEFMDDLLTIEAASYVDPATNQGFFRVRIVPREAQSVPILPKRVTFVVDASTSIIQYKLDLTARALADCIRRLRPEDKFNVVIFRDSPTMFRPEPVHAAPETVEEALAFLSDIESRGATDVYSAIRPIIQAPPPEGIASFVLVASDGRPTSGSLAGRELINALTSENGYRNTIHTFGGGKTVNQYLLDLLAYRNKGVAHVASRIEDISQELPSFFGQFDDPILVDLTADYSQIRESGVFPKELPDFYQGRVVTVYGTFHPDDDKEIVMRLHGRAGASLKEVIFKADLQETRTGDRQIARNWAFQKIYYLIGEITRLGERPELMAELRDLSRIYGIETSYYR